MGRQLAELIVPERYREAHCAGPREVHEDRQGPDHEQADRADGAPPRRPRVPGRDDGHAGAGPRRIRFNAFMHDISERKQVEQEAVKLSAVTGTGNGGGPDS